MERRRLTRTLWFWCWVLFVNIAASSNRAFCQDPHDYVPNLPYTAQVVGTGFEVLADGTRVQRKSRVIQMRDSQGRTRVESFASYDPNCGNDRCRPNVVNLYVPLRHQFIQIFPASKTASVQSWGTGPAPTHGQDFGKTKSESLPGRTMNGIYVVGTRTTHFIPSDGGRGPDVVEVDEKWVSPDLKITVLGKHKNTNTGSDETITEIRELDRSEPEAALFEIPAGYKIVTVADGAQPEPGSRSPNAEQDAIQP